MQLAIAIYKKYEDKINFEYVEDCLKSVKAWLFCQDLIHIGNKYLGCSFDIGSESENYNMLLDDIFDAGLFGNKGSDRTLAAVLTRTALKDAGKKESEQNKIKQMFSTLVPGKEWLYATNPKIKQNPLLAVPAYLGRIKKGASFLVKGRKHNKQGVDLSKRRIDLLHKYGVL